MKETVVSKSQSFLLVREHMSVPRKATLENGKGCERRPGGGSRGGVLYTSAIHILQYGRGVAGRLGVAYRRHADVRRSANDWSIATRRFSPRKLFVPFSLPWPAGLTYGRNLRALHAYACVGERMQILVEQPHQAVGGSSLWEKPFSLSQPIALRLCLRGSSRVDLFTSPSARFLKNGGSF